MAGEAIPTDASGGAPSNTGAEWRKAQAALLNNGTSDAFGARPGRRPGLGMIASSTTTTWTVTAGSFVAMPNFAAGQGPYLCEFPSNETGSLTAPHATLPRKDILYVIVDDAGVGDGSGARQARVAYLAGTANASPVAPSVPTRGNLLATLTVPASGGGNPTVVMAAVAVAAGGILPVADSTERGGIASPFVGEAVYEASTGRIGLYNGSAFRMGTILDIQTASNVTTVGGTGGVGPVSFARPFASSPIVIVQSGDLAAWDGPAALYLPDLSASQFSFNPYTKSGAGMAGVTIRYNYIAVGIGT